MTFSVNLSVQTFSSCFSMVLYDFPSVLSQLVTHRGFIPAKLASFCASNPPCSQNRCHKYAIPLCFSLCFISWQSGVEANSCSPHVIYNCNDCVQTGNRGTHFRRRNRNCSLDLCEPLLPIRQQSLNPEHCSSVSCQYPNLRSCGQS